MNQHTCPHPDCAASVPLDMYSCRPHWFSLPKQIRDEIWAGYREGRLSNRWLAADKQAKAFWSTKEATNEAKTRSGNS